MPKTPDTFTLARKLKTMSPFGTAETLRLSHRYYVTRAYSKFEVHNSKIVNAVPVTFHLKGNSLVQFDILAEQMIEFIDK